MAEESSGTQTAPGQATAPGTEGPESSTQAASTTVDLPLAPHPAAPDAQAAQLARDIQEMRTLAERHKQQIQGWEQQSRKHQEEKAQLQTQLAQYDTILKSVGAIAQPGAAAAKPKPASFREAMDRYLAGDDSALEAYSPTPPQAEVEAVVDQRLNTYLSYMNKQQAVTTAHPELNDRSNPLYKDVFESYDTLAADPLHQTLYPEDPAMKVDMLSPDGLQRKSMDLRLLHTAVLQAKARGAREAGAQEETTRRQAGDAMSGNGRQVQATNQVEAFDLFGADERREWRNQINQRAWPKQWPTEDRAIAKYLWDGLRPEEKQQRLEAYRERQRRP